jgi:hypothetical protein
MRRLSSASSLPASAAGILVSKAWHADVEQFRLRNLLLGLHRLELGQRHGSR